MDTRPIGMFDSGCGGLTVLKEYLKLMPNEDFIYYGDTAHLPYGDKSKEKIIEYSEEAIRFFIEKNVKIIIIACGTASALAYEYLSSKYDIEIRNIITPVAQNITSKKIGIIATKATIKSNAWENAILKYHKNVKISSVACPLFVPLIEEGFANCKTTDYFVKEYIKRLDNSIDTLILGCTHYPILKEKIKNALKPNVNLINVGEESAKDTLDFLKKNNMQNPSTNKGNIDFYSSDDFNSFKENAKNIGFSIIETSKI